MNSAEQPKADVSVVIPTALRSTLPRAVRSVLAQALPPAQVLVVLDSRAARQRSSDQEAVLAAVEALPCVSVLVDADAAPGANSARNRGVAAARHRWLALLDDEDGKAILDLVPQAAPLADEPVLLQRQARVAGVEGAAEDFQQFLADHAHPR